MPIYEYSCQACGAEIEVLHKGGDPLKKKCPKCGGRLKKRVSAPAFQFKGSGWYITDYAKKNSVKTGEPKDKPKSDKPSVGKKDDSSSSSGKD